MTKHVIPAFLFTPETALLCGTQKEKTRYTF